MSDISSNRSLIIEPHFIKNDCILYKLLNVAITYVQTRSNKLMLTFVNGMYKKLKKGTCLKTPANSNLISQVYKNWMKPCTRYLHIRNNFESKIMFNIQNSLEVASISLNTEKVNQFYETGGESA